MKTLHRYLTGQVLASLFVSVAVFTFVLLLGNVLKEVLVLLVNQQASLLIVGQAIGLLIPYVLVFALPMGLLTATLLTFGRFSADNELIAVRASGISLLSLISPILVMSVVLSIGCAFVNLEWAPRCRLAYKHLIYRAANEGIGRLLPERTVIREFTPYIIYFGRVRGSDLRNIDVYEIEKGGTNVVNTWRAPRGSYSIDRATKTIHLVMRDVWWSTVREGERQPIFVGELPIDMSLPEKPQKDLGISELTFRELWQKRKELQALGISSGPVNVQIHSQVAFSFACIGFTLIGIPLGIRAHRRETSVGMALAIVLVILYYSFLILGQSLETKEKLYPWLIVWLPNFFFQIIGMFLLRKANRGV